MRADKLNPLRQSDHITEYSFIHIIPWTMQTKHVGSLVRYNFEMTMNWRWKYLWAKLLGFNWIIKCALVVFLSENTASTKYQNKWNIHTYVYYVPTLKKRHNNGHVWEYASTYIYIMVSKWYMIGTQGMKFNRNRTCSNFQC